MELNKVKLENENVNDDAGSSPVEIIYEQSPQPELKKNTNILLDTLVIGPFKDAPPSDEEIRSSLASKGCAKIKDLAVSTKEHVIYLKFETEQDARDAHKRCSGALTIDDIPLFVYLKEMPSLEVVRASSPARSHSPNQTSSRQKNYKLIKNNRRWQKEKDTSSRRVSRFNTNRSNVKAIDRSNSTSSHKSYNLPNLMEIKTNPNPVTTKVPSLMDLDIRPPGFGIKLSDEFCNAGLSAAVSEFVPPGLGLDSGARIYDNTPQVLSIIERPLSPPPESGPLYDAAVVPDRFNQQLSSLLNREDWERWQSRQRGRSRSRSRSPAGGRRWSREPSEERRDRDRRCDNDFPRKRSPPPSPRIVGHIQSYCNQIAERLSRMNDQQICFARMKIEEALYDAEFGLNRRPKNEHGDLAMDGLSGGLNSAVVNEQLDHRSESRNRSGAAAAADDYRNEYYPNPLMDGDGSSRSLSSVVKRNATNNSATTQQATAFLSEWISSLNKERKYV